MLWPITHHFRLTKLVPKSYPKTFFSRSLLDYDYYSLGEKKQEADIEQGLWDFYYFQLIRRLGCPVGKLTNFENKLEALRRVESAFKL